MNDIDAIMAYDNGDLEEGEIIALFSRLVKSGLAWRLQGHHAWMAAGLIAAGILTSNGDIVDDLEGN